ncbi:MAG: replication-associated recombination protein A [Clostridiales bacterium]|nr:replication-associated recombination protein A [Clostridiales bacterium]
MDLFEYQAQKSRENEAPLAARLRPSTLEEFVGQEEIVGEGKLLYRAIKADKLTSVIFYGPPGTGKTTLAKIIAGTTQSRFEQLNATTSGIKDIKDVVERAKRELGFDGRKTILFIDEIHRFNKTQQDTLLPYVEDGVVILIGATTENPFFEVNRALLSRSIVFELKKLSKENIKTILKRAVYDKEKGMGSYKAEITEEALDFLADTADGDARVALNAVELGVLTTERNEDGVILIDLETAGECIQRRVLSYDKKGNNHYDTASAFIKSMRGSDPDAAVYYLARMLASGEDIKFIARRIVICAAEDVGMADPNALRVAVSAAWAADFVGMPEARIILSEAVCYVASAPKSNASYLAVNKALQDVEKVRVETIPIYLKDIHYEGHEVFGNGNGYKYAHDYENHYVDQQYLPDEVKDRVYYEPTGIGYEQEVLKYFRKIKGDKK